MKPFQRVKKWSQAIDPTYKTQDWALIISESVFDFLITMT